MLQKFIMLSFFIRLKFNCWVARENLNLSQGIFAAGNPAILYKHACAQAYIDWFNKKAIAVWGKNIIPIYNTKQYNSKRIWYLFFAPHCIAGGGYRWVYTVILYRYSAVYLRYMPCGHLIIKLAAKLEWLNES